MDHVSNKIGGFLRGGSAILNSLRAVDKWFSALWLCRRRDGRGLVEIDLVGRLPAK